MSAAPARTERPSELAAGFLAVISIVGSALGLVYQPVKLIPFAIVLALIATGMAAPKSRLPLIAVAFGSICFVAGMTIAVVLNHRLY
jgi:hypothetical protein